MPDDFAGNMEDRGMKHPRGAPYLRQNQGKIVEGSVDFPSPENWCLENVVFTNLGMLLSSDQT